MSSSVAAPWDECSTWWFPVIGASVWLGQGVVSALTWWFPTIGASSDGFTGLGDEMRGCWVGILRCGTGQLMGIASLIMSLVRGGWLGAMIELVVVSAEIEGGRWVVGSGSTTGRRRQGLRRLWGVVAEQRLRRLLRF